MVTDPYGAFCTHTDVAVEGAAEGPLAGLSFGVKDLFDVAGHPAACGHPDWLATHPPAERTAPVITTLLEAGATCAGKTHTDELAWSLNGENVHYGTPVNPGAPGRIPGGSSSGSAVAVAGGLVDFALGTDTAGSVRVPASYCGILGLRPTYGRVSPEGAMPLAAIFDTVGWFARTAGVLRAVGRVLLNDGEREPAGPPGLLLAEDCFALCGDRQRQALLAAAQQVADRLALVPERVAVSEEGLETWKNAFRRLQGREVWNHHGAWFEATRPRFGPGVRERFEAASQLAAECMAEEEALRERVKARMARLLGEGHLLLLPTTGVVAPPCRLPAAELDPIRDHVLRLTSIAGLAGLPQLNLPLARLDGLPLGLSLAVAPNRDEVLLRVAERMMQGPQADHRNGP
ncbi:MAG: amidase [bacterium]|nr:amidase [bacterium]